MKRTDYSRHSEVRAMFAGDQGAQHPDYYYTDQEEIKTCLSCEQKFCTGNCKKVRRI